MDDKDKKLLFPVMSEDEITKMVRLPKWAQNAILRFARQNDRLHDDIDELCGDGDSAVTLMNRLDGNKSLGDKAQIKFRLDDSSILGSHENYTHRNYFTIRIVDDIHSGGNCLEVMYGGDGGFVVTPQCSNVIRLCSSDSSRKDFLEFIPYDKDDV